MAENKAWHWPDKLTQVNWSQVTVASNSGWARLLSEDTGMKVHLPVEADLVRRFRGVGDGDYDMVPGYSSETAQMLASDKAFAGEPPFAVGIVWAYSKSNSGFIVNGNVPIRTPHDIRPGTKMVDVSSFLSTRFYQALLAWAEVKQADIDWVPAHSTPEVAELVASGKAAIAYATPHSNTARTAARGPAGIHWIELNAEEDPEGAARFSEVYPLAQFGVIPEGAEANAAGTWGTESINYFLATASADTGLIYRLAKWFDENYDRFAPMHPDNRFRSRQVLLKGLVHTFIPLHPGLISYLDEKGLWTEAHARRESGKEELVSRYREAYRAALRVAKEQGVTGDPKSQAWQDFWYQYRQGQRLKPFRQFPGLDTGSR